MPACDSGPSFLPRDSSPSFLPRTSKISACHAWSLCVLAFSFSPPFFSLSLSPPSRLYISLPTSYVELPPFTPPFRASSKAIRMATTKRHVHTYTKTKNFFVRTTGNRPLFHSDLYRSCLFVRERAFSRRPDFAFCILCTAFSPCPLWRSLFRRHCHSASPS